MSHVEMTDRFDQMQTYLTELDELTTLPTLTKKQQNRHAFLLSAISAIKAGATRDEVRNFERRQLLEAAGYRGDETPTNLRIPEQADREWRGFLRGDKMKPIVSIREAESRDMQAGQQSVSYTQGAAGGFWKPPDFANRAFFQARVYDQIFDDNNCTVIWTDDGNVKAYPVWDDTSTSGFLVGEGVQVNDQGLIGNIVPPNAPTSQPGDLGAGGGSASVQLGAFKFGSGNIRVSLELIDDSAFPLPAVIEKAAAIRFARVIGYYMINGSGVGQPSGIITSALANGAVVQIAAGASVNDGGAETGANSIGSQDLYKAYHNLDPLYRYNARWLMQDSTLASIDQLTDKNGRPLFTLRDGAPYLLGKPIVISPSMPAIGAAKNSVVFYSPDYFISRRVTMSDVGFQAFRERFIDFGEIGLLGWMRADSNLLTTGTGKIPATIIQNHS